jgi:hypothetical protein
MPDVITGNTEIGNTKQGLIAAIVQKELAFRAKLTPFFTDLSALVGPGMQSISVPKLSSFTVADRAEGVAGEVSALTSSVDKLELNQNLYVSWIIDAMTAVQSNIPAQLEFARRAAAAQARKIDELIIAELRSISFAFLNVGTDANVTYGNLTSMVRELEENDAELMDCVWLVSPAQKEAMFALTEVKQAQNFGQAVLPSGVIGQFLGCPVVLHSGLAGKELFLAEKSGLAYAFQKTASYGEEDKIEYGVGAKRAAIDQLFGLKGMQLGQKGAASGKSPLVIGLND